MLISKHSSRDWGLDEAQFALALAVDRLSGPDEAKVVLSFLGKQYIKDSVYYESSIVDYTLMDAGTNVMAQRKQLESKLGANKILLYNYINFVMHNNIYHVTKRIKRDGKVINRDYKNKSLPISLNDLIPNITVNKLYEASVQILYKYDKGDLLYAYMDSQLFKIEFTKYLKMVHSEGYNGYRNVYDNATVSYIISIVKSAARSVSSGKNFDLTGNNPTAYVNNYYTEMFMKDISKNRAVYLALQSHGSFSEVKGTDGIQAYLLNDIPDDMTESESSDINFSSLAIPIYEASNLLFSHNGKIQEDIFSVIKHERVKDRYDKMSSDLSKYLPEFRLKFIEEHEYYTAGDLETMKDKYSARRDICKVFINKLEMNGILRSDIYDIFVECLQVTEKTRDKNGARLFSSSKTQRVSSGYTNASIMKILVRGFIALYKLIKYLDSSENNTGVTVENMPIDAFRNLAVAKSYKNLETYAKSIGVHRQLEAQIPATNDSGVSLMSNAQVFLNIYNIAMEKDQALKNSKRSKIVKEFFNTPITAMTDKAHKSFKTTDELVADLHVQVFNQLSAEVPFLELTTTNTISSIGFLCDGALKYNRVNRLFNNNLIKSNFMDEEGNYLVSEDVIDNERKKFYASTSSLGTLGYKIELLLSVFQIYNYLGSPLVEEINSENYRINDTIAERYLVEKNENPNSIFTLISEESANGITNTLKHLLMKLEASPNEPLPEQTKVVINAYKSLCSEFPECTGFKQIIEASIKAVFILLGVDYDKFGVDASLAFTYAGIRTSMFYIKKIRTLMTEISTWLPKKGDKTSNMYLYYSMFSKLSKDITIPRFLRIDNELDFLGNLYALDDRSIKPLVPFDMKLAEYATKVYRDIINMCLNKVPLLFEYNTIMRNEIREQLEEFDEFITFDLDKDMYIKKASLEIESKILSGYNNIEWDVRLHEFSHSFKTDSLGYIMKGSTRLTSVDEETNSMILYHSRGFKVFTGRRIANRYIEGSFRQISSTEMDGIMLSLTK